MDSEDGTGQRETFMESVTLLDTDCIKLSVLREMRGGHEEMEGSGEQNYPHNIPALQE